MIKYLLIAITLWMNVSMAASYSVKVKGRSAGKAELSFSENQSSYAVKLALYPIALAKMFGIDDMIESASGSIHQGHYRPKVYQRKEIDGKTLLKVVFSGQQVDVKNKKGKHRFDVHASGQDPLTQMAQIKYDLSHQALANSYYLITDSSQRQYSAKQQQTAKGYHVVLTQKPAGDRVLNLWFDKHFELQRMEKRKRGKSDFEIVRIKP